MSYSEPILSAKLEPVDLQRLRHLLGVVLALVGISGLLAVENLQWLWSALGLVAVMAALLFPGIVAARGPRVWRWVGAGVVVYAVADLLVTILTERQALIAAVVRVTLAITVLRAMQPRRRRDDMQLILLSLFLAATGGALSLSPVFAAQVFVFIPLAGGVLFLINLLEGEVTVVPPDAHWAAFTWRDFAGHVRGAWTWRFALFLSAAVGVVVVSGALIFAVLPRFRMDNAVPFMELPASGKTGVSEGVTLGEVAEITPDESLAFRADAPLRTRPGVNPYWRLAVLDQYDGSPGRSAFTLSRGAELSFLRPGRGALWTTSLPPAAMTSPFFPRGEWVVHLEGNVSRFIPAAGVLSRIRFDKSQEWRDSEGLRLVRLDKTPATSLHMQVEVADDLAVYAPPPAEARRLTALTAGPAGQYPATLLELPPDAASRRALSASLADFGGDKGMPLPAFLTKASDWLASRHAYARRDGYGVRRAAPGEAQDYLVRWMRSGGTGWCEHFATSMVLLARSAGYPARLVTGFSGGEWNEADSYLLVRMKHAHAWCEVYDREVGLWRRIDPTPVGGDGAAVESSDARQGIRSFSGLAAWYDGVTMLWFRSVVNFEESNQREAARSMLTKLSTWRADLEAWAKQTRESVAAAFARWRAAPAAALPWLGGVLAVCAVAYAARKLLVHLRHRRLRERRDGDPVVRACRRRAGRWLLRIDAAVAAGRVVPVSVRADVECIRYGRPAEWADPETVFVAAAKSLRR